MGVNGLWGSAGLALYGIVPGVLITLASWRAAFIVPGIVCVAVGARARPGRSAQRQGRRPADARDGRRAGRPRRVLARLLRALRHHGAGGRRSGQAVMFGAALVFETRLADDIASLRDALASWGLVDPGRAVGRPRDLA